MLETSMEAHLVTPRAKFSTQPVQSQSLTLWQRTRHSWIGFFAGAGHKNHVTSSSVRQEHTASFTPFKAPCYTEMTM